MAEHYNQIGQALTAASTYDANVRSHAEQYLKYAETNVPQYYVTLQQIYLQADLDDQVRLAAAIAFKNGIDKYWRKSATNAIPEPEKHAIRENLFTTTPCSNQVRRQVSTSIAKIARIDYPSDWPDLFTHLLSQLQSQSNESILFAHMETLKEIVKTMSSVRTARARQNFQEVAPQIMEYVFAYYSNYSQRWLADNLSVESIRMSDVALKIARRLVCHGYERPYQNETCRKFFALLSSQILTMWSRLQIAGQSDATSAQAECLSKHLLHAGKFFMELSANPMENFGMNHNFALMPGSIDLVGHYWHLATMAAETTSEDIQKIVIQGLILLRQCIKLAATPETHLKLMGGVERAAIDHSLRILREELFSEQSLTKILEGLIMRFLVLRDKDKEDWEDDPEAWILTQDASHWEYDVRPCAEKVLLDLFAHYRKTLSQPLLNVLASSADHFAGEGLLLKEAMYNALGVVAPHLFEDFDFDSFLDRLIYESNMPSVLPIFRRRIVILVSQWINVKCSPEKRPYVYQIVGKTLQDESFGLSLNAAFQVENLLNAWDWENEPFEPYAAAFIETLIRVLARSGQIESKMRILTGIGLVYERIDSHVVTRLDLVLEQVPLQWDQTEADKHLLRVALLSLLSRLALRKQLNTAQGYQIVMPLISYSMDPENFEHIYLVEEALELWHAILQHASGPDEHLLQLVPLLTQPSILSGSTDILPKVLSIIESNLLLFQQESISLSLLQNLMHQMIAMLPELPAKVVSHFSKVIELGIQNLHPQNFSDDDLSSLMQLLLRDGNDTVTTTCMLCLLCQVTVLNLPRMSQVWQQSSQGDLTASFLKTIFDRFDDLGQAKRRKLCALALSAMTRTQHPLFKDENVLAGLGNIWSDVLAEVQANAGNDLVYWVDESILYDDIIPDSAESQRRKQLAGADPVCTVALREYIRESAAYVDTQSLGINLESFMS